MTHHIEHFPYRHGEVILLLPYNNSHKVLVGVNRIPFLHRMDIPYDVTSYELFECSKSINYIHSGDTVQISDREQVRNYLKEFSELVYALLESAGDIVTLHNSR